VGRVSNVIAAQGARYSVRVDQESRKPSLRVGLCETCKFMRRIESDRGSIFYMCQRSLTDASFPKYPRLPVSQCRGYDPIDEDQFKALKDRRSPKS